MLFSNLNIIMNIQNDKQYWAKLEWPAAPSLIDSPVEEKLLGSAANITSGTNRIPLVMVIVWYNPS